MEIRDAAVVAAPNGRDIVTRLTLRPPPPLGTHPLPLCTAMSDHRGGPPQGAISVKWPHHRSTLVAAMVRLMSVPLLDCRSPSSPFAPSSSMGHHGDCPSSPPRFSTLLLSQHSLLTAVDGNRDLTGAASMGQMTVDLIDLP
jgi:hypothetical protein